MRSQRGMTLLEVLVANAIFTLFIVVALTFMAHMSEAVSVDYQAVTLEQDANSVLEELAQNLRAAQVTPRTGEKEDLGSWYRPTKAGQICFQVPVDHDEDGDTMKVDGENFVTEWGAKREDVIPADYLDGYMIYRFVATRQFVEADRMLDLNRDGDMDDEFDVGHIEIVYPGGGEHLGTPPPTGNNVAVRMMSGNSVIRVKGEDVADIDGDGQGTAQPELYYDPMFSTNGSVLTITIFTSKPEEKRPILIKATTSIDLRNNL